MKSLKAEPSSLSLSRNIFPGSQRPSPSYTVADLSQDSAQLLYAEVCQQDKGIAGLGSDLYCWTGDHWSVQEETDNVRHALEWLQINARKRTSMETARGCVDTAIGLIKPLPPRPDPQTVLVPVTGVWLVLDDSGDWVAQEPQREVGVCHRIASSARIPFGRYEPKSVPPKSLFARFLNRSLPDLGVQTLVQDFIGYSLCGSTAMQVAHLWVGGGNNGKSVLMNIVKKLHERTAAMELDKLQGFAMTSVVGASLVACDESPQRRINQQTLKSLITGGAVNIEPKYRSAYSYVPTAKWLINANSIPNVRDHTDGWWRRFQIIDWSVRIPEEEVIPDLDQKILRTELDIVLDWALIGLRRVAMRGFKKVSVLPEAVTRAHFNAMLQTNSVMSWKDECGISVESDSYQDKGVLFDNYLEHCERIRTRPFAEPQFFARLIQLFPEMNERKLYVGVGTSRRRVRCVNLATGRFSDMSASGGQARQKPADIGTDDELDPFAELVAQALAIPKISAINI